MIRHNETYSYFVYLQKSYHWIKDVPANSRLMIGMFIALRNIKLEGNRG